MTNPIYQPKKLERMPSIEHIDNWTFKGPGIHVSEMSGSKLNDRRVKSAYPVVLYTGPEMISAIPPMPIISPSMPDQSRFMVIECLLACDMIKNRRNWNQIKARFYRELKREKGQRNWSTFTLRFGAFIAPFFPLIAMAIPLIIATLITCGIVAYPIFVLFSILGA